MRTIYSRYFPIASLLLLASCGGGSGSTASTADTSLPTATQLATYSDAQIVALGTSINQLSNSTLEALTYATNNTTNPTGQIESLTAAQIAALSPAQVQLIGAAGAGGVATTPLIRYLNAGAWAQLVNNPAQVAAMTAEVIPTLTGDEIAAFGNNMNQLSNAALAALTYATNASSNPIGQIESITPGEIAALSPAQIRLIGAAGPGGVNGTSEIAWLNSGTWSILASNPTQVASITPDEIPTLSASKIVALGSNINQLSSAALAALTYTTNASTNPIGQIESITAAQIATLSPAQVQLIGSAGAGGVITTPNISWLNAGAWETLVSNPAQVAAFTANEIPTLSANEIVALGSNLNQLSNAALAALSYGTNASSNPIGQIESITAFQLAGLSPAQVSILASISRGTAIAYLNTGVFGAFTADQIAVITPANIVDVSATELAALSVTTLAGMMPSTIASLTSAQKSLLSSAQHTACGC